MSDALFTPSGELQPTMDTMVGHLSNEDIAMLLEEPSLPALTAQAVTKPRKTATKVTSKATTTTTPQALVPLQGTKKDTTMTTRTKKTPATAAGWVIVNSRDADAVAKYGQSVGITPSGIQQLQVSLLEQNFLSPVQLFDLSPKFTECDGTTQMTHSDFLIGSVAIGTGGGDSIQRGFHFAKNVAQKVILAKGLIFTEMDQPDPITRLMQGPAQAIFCAFPETVPGVPAQVGTNGRALLPYRPLLRIIAQNITNGFNGTEEGGDTNNIFFQAKTRGVGRFNDLVPNFIYEDALKSGITNEDFLVRVTNTWEIAQRSQHRANNPRNRTNNQQAVLSNQGTGAPLAGFNQTRDTTSLSQSIGSTSYNPNA